MVAGGSLVAPVAVVLSVALAGGGHAGQGVAGSGGGVVGGVPAEYVDVVVRAGSVCEGVSPSLVAAQADHESAHTWDPRITSPAGAVGIAQFMPATWAVHGRDGDGDGAAEIANGIDSIWSQGNYICDLSAQVGSWLAEGAVSGDPVDLALAAYNAGPGAVRSWGGVPPYSETRGYIASIKDALPRFPYTPAGGAGGGAGGAVARARAHLGTPYVWGGDEPGGVDCSGLVLLAFREAGDPFPSRLTADGIVHSVQVTPIARSELRAGDLIGFSYGPGARVHHIGIYSGTGPDGSPMMVHAPDVGGVVEEVSLGGAYWQGLEWHTVRKTS